MKKIISGLMAILTMGVCMACKNDDDFTDPVQVYSMQNAALGEYECAINVVAQETSTKNGLSVGIAWNKIEGLANLYIGVGDKYEKVSADEQYYVLQNKYEITKNGNVLIYVVCENTEGKLSVRKSRPVQTFEGTPTPRIMAYFLDGGKTGAEQVDEQNLHFCYTLDGSHWQSLNNNKAVFKLTTLGGNMVRDPYIVKKPDGKYLMIATDWTLYKSDSTYGGTEWHYERNNYWDVNTTALIFADSDDLITWTNERQIQMVSDEAKRSYYANQKTDKGELWKNYQFCWAPELICDEDSNGNAKVIHVDPETKEEYKYGVIWSGSGETNGIESKSWNIWTKCYEKTTGHHSGYRRTFVNWTNDFETFTEPEVFFDPTPVVGGVDSPNSNIDASVCSAVVNGKKKFYLAFKDERSGYYGTGLCWSDSLEPNSFNRNVIHSRGYDSRQIQEVAGGYYNQGEGMFMYKPFKDVDKWYMILDAHDAKQSKVFALFETTDFENWTTNDSTSYPSGAIRHGCQVPVTHEHLKQLIQAFGI